MLVSKDDKELYISHLKKIEDYVRKNYIPRLKICEQIDVSFTERSKTDREHYFYLDRNSGRISYDGMSFNPSEKDNIYEKWMLADVLFLHWSIVKEKIEQELTAREDMRKAIADFDVACGCDTEKSKQHVLLTCSEGGVFSTPLIMDTFDEALQEMKRQFLDAAGMNSIGEYYDEGLEGYSGINLKTGSAWVSVDGTDVYWEIIPMEIIRRESSEFKAKKENKI